MQVQVGLESEGIDELAASDRDKLVQAPLEVSLLQLRLPDVIGPLMSETGNRTGHDIVEVQIEVQVHRLNAPIVLGVVLRGREIFRRGSRLEGTASGIDVEARKQKTAKLDALSGEVVPLAHVVDEDLLSAFLGNSRRPKGGHHDEND